MARPASVHFVHTNSPSIEPSEGLCLLRRSTSYLWVDEKRDECSGPPRRSLQTPYGEGCGWSRGTTWSGLYPSAGGGDPEMSVMVEGR